MVSKINGYLVIPPGLTSLNVSVDNDLVVYLCSYVICIGHNLNVIGVRTAVAVIVAIVGSCVLVCIVFVTILVTVVLDLNAKPGANGFLCGFVEFEYRILSCSNSFFGGTSGHGCQSENHNENQCE